MDPVVLGIAGGTASGKSTLARALVEVLGEECVGIVHDRYYHSLPSHIDAADWNFDHPTALDTPRLVRDLQALRAGRSISLPRYDFHTCSRLDEEDAVGPRPYIVVEGILVMADAALRACFDHRVYVETPDDLRLIRRIRRDAAHRGSTPEQTMLQYERTVRPMHVKHVAPSSAHAELVLDGTRDVLENVREVLGLLGRPLSPRPTAP